MSPADISTLSLHDALPIYPLAICDAVDRPLPAGRELHHEQLGPALVGQQLQGFLQTHRDRAGTFVQKLVRDRKSTRLNSSHTVISYAVFCLKKKTENARHR